MLQQHESQNWAVVGLAGLAVVCLALAVFLSWGSVVTHWESEGGSMFGMTIPGASGTASEAYTLFEIDGTSWYEERFDETSGVQTIRVAIPLFLVGAVLVLAGTILASVPPGRFDGRRLVSTGLLAGGALFGLLGVLLHLVGIFDIMDEIRAGGADTSWGFEIGQLFVWIGVVAAIGAVVTTFVWNPFQADGASTDGPRTVS